MTTTDPQPARDRLVEYLYASVAEAIRGWDAGRADIYGIWFDVALAEDDPSRPGISSIAALTQGHTTDALARDYGSRYSDGCSAPETRIDLRLCEETGEWYSQPGVPGDPEGRALRNAFFDERGLPPPDRNFAGPDRERHLVAFLDACGAMIRRLHDEGVIIAVCGHPVPIGIGFSNDIDRQISLAVVRASNPPDIDRGIEEAIMGITYEQIAAQEALIAEVAARPLAEQARFWTDANIAHYRRIRLHESSPLAEQLQAVHMYDLDPLLLQVGAPLVLVLLDEIEPCATVRRWPHRSIEGFKESLACDFLRMIAQVAADPEERTLVRETEVTRLEQLLVRLYNESVPLAEISNGLLQTASALHALRPKRYPAPQSGSGRQQNRLVNWRDFGLDDAS